MLYLKTFGGLSVEAEDASASGAARRRKTPLLKVALELDPPRTTEDPRP